MDFDLDKIPQLEWTYQDEDDAWRQGVLLRPDEGVIFWGERLDGEDGGAYRMSFREFLRTKEFRSTPLEIINEIRQILRAAKTKS
ncbi:MAG: hypothetical protein GY835_00090 [bacterium]|nr:hypothetical protein [bacterium]